MPKSKNYSYCPYCESNGCYYLQRFDQRYNLCSRCGLIFKDVQKTYHESVREYRINYYKKFRKEQHSGHRSKLFEYILNLIEQMNPSGGHLLDVGTGLGQFLVYAQQRGWTVQGVEPSHEAAEFAQKRSKLDVFQGTLNEYESHSLFDAVTCINVLDHSVEPWSDLKKIRRLLKSQGIAYFRFPNGFLHAWLSRWAHALGMEDTLDRYLIFHEFSFTPRFIEVLLSDFGFVCITIQNSPPSMGDPYQLFSNGKKADNLKKAVFHFSRLIDRISGGNVLLGSSLEVLASKKS